LDSVSEKDTVSILDTHLKRVYGTPVASGQALPQTASRLKRECFTRRSLPKQHFGIKREEINPSALPFCRSPNPFGSPVKARATRK